MRSFADDLSGCLYMFQCPRTNARSQVLIVEVCLDGVVVLGVGRGGQTIRLQLKSPSFVEWFVMVCRFSVTT